MPRKIIGFCPDKIYHISNIGNTGEDIFISEENYIYFLRKFASYTRGIFEVIAYCLLPNQYHILLKVKKFHSLNLAYSRRKRIPAHKVELDMEEMSRFLSQEIGNFLNAYAKAFNKRHGRKGSLFRENFKKRPVDEMDVKSLIVKLQYIPVNQGFVDFWQEWKFSSGRKRIGHLEGVMNYEKFGKYYDFDSLEEMQILASFTSTNNIILV